MSQKCWLLQLNSLEDQLQQRGMAGTWGSRLFVQDMAPTRGESVLLWRCREKQVYKSSLSGFKLFFGLFINFVWLWVRSQPGTVTFGFIIAVLLSALYQECLPTCSCLLTHRNDKKKSHTFVKSMLKPPWQNPCPSASIVATKGKKDRKERGEK